MGLPGLEELTEMSEKDTRKLQEGIVRLLRKLREHLAEKTQSTLTFVLTTNKGELDIARVMEDMRIP